MISNVKSYWSGGDLYFSDKDNDEILHFDGTNRKLVIPSGSEIDFSAATVTGLTVVSVSSGFIPLHLASARLIGSNDIPNSGAGDGGIVSQDTAPKLERVNDATDQKLRIVWASTGVVPITWDFPYPPDLDDSAAVVVNLLAKMAAGGMDTPTIGVGYFEGIGDSNAGGNTAALSTTLAHLTVSIAAGDVGAYPTGASVTLTPAAHANEALELYGAWITYTRAVS